MQSSISSLDIFQSHLTAAMATASEISALMYIFLSFPCCLHGARSKIFPPTKSISAALVNNTNSSGKCWLRTPCLICLGPDRGVSELRLKNKYMCKYVCLMRHHENKSAHRCGSGCTDLAPCLGDTLWDSSVIQTLVIYSLVVLFLSVLFHSVELKKKIAFFHNMNLTFSSVWLQQVFCL